MKSFLHLRKNEEAPSQQCGGAFMEDSRLTHELNFDCKTASKIISEDELILLSILTKESDYLSIDILANDL